MSEINKYNKYDNYDTVNLFKKQWSQAVKDMVNNIGEYTTSSGNRDTRDARDAQVANILQEEVYRQNAEIKKLRNEVDRLKGNTDANGNTIPSTAPVRDAILGLDVKED